MRRSKSSAPSGSSRKASTISRPIGGLVSAQRQRQHVGVVVAAGHPGRLGGRRRAPPGRPAPCSRRSTPRCPTSSSTTPRSAAPLGHLARHRGAGVDPLLVAAGERPVQRPRSWPGLAQRGHEIVGQRRDLVRADGDPHRATSRVVLAANLARMIIRGGTFGPVATNTYVVADDARRLGLDRRSGDGRSAWVHETLAAPRGDARSPCSTRTATGTTSSRTTSGTPRACRCGWRRADADWLEAPSPFNPALFGDLPPTPGVTPARLLADGDVLELGDLRFRLHRHARATRRAAWWPWRRPTARPSWATWSSPRASAAPTSRAATRARCCQPRAPVRRGAARDAHLPGPRPVGRHARRGRALRADVHVSAPTREAVIELLRGGPRPRAAPQHRRPRHGGRRRGAAAAGSRCRSA